MFTKEDYKKYFQEVQRIEDLMGAEFLEAAERITSPEIKQIFLNMHADEISHGKIASGMIDLLDDLAPPRK